MKKKFFVLLLIVALVLGDVQAKKKKKKNKAPKAKGKASAPGQLKKLPSAGGSGRPAPHPKYANASPNAAFKRDILRDPNADLYEDWKDEWKNPGGSDNDDNIDDLFPTPSPLPVPSPTPVVPGPTPSPRPSPTPSPTPSGPLTLTQRRRIESLTSVFEFSNIVPQYGYAENIGDGRGITFGRCGFCTGTGDGLLVIEEYTRRKPGNTLAKYLPALRRINNEKSGESNDDTTGLSGFISAVRALGNDATFRAVQDYAHQLMYMKPSQRAADVLGLKLALSKGQLYDAYFMHGENQPGDAFYPKSANGMAAYVNKQLGGSPAQGVDEKKWMRAYLARRRTILTTADQVWKAAANRIDIYRFLANGNAWNLNAAIKLQQGSCGSTGVCSRSSSSVAVGPAVYGNFNIN